MKLLQRLAKTEECLAGMMASLAINGGYVDEEMKSWIKATIKGKTQTPVQVWRELFGGKDGTFFKVGERVKWSSQSNGSRTFKEGTVILVVPAGKVPNTTGKTLGWPEKLRIPGSGFGGRRNHESYVVRVGTCAYWPRVLHLQPA